MSLLYFISFFGQPFCHISYIWTVGRKSHFSYIQLSFLERPSPLPARESETSGALLLATARNICPQHIQEREDVPLSDPLLTRLCASGGPIQWDISRVHFSSAVFGSYLRPDLVPANHAYYDSSSMGTISNSSVFVNVDNQTEDRYDLGSCLCSAPALSSPSLSKHAVCCTMQR